MQDGCIGQGSKIAEIRKKLGLEVENPPEIGKKLSIIKDWFHQISLDRDYDIVISGDMSSEKQPKYLKAETILLYRKLLGLTAIPEPEFFHLIRHVDLIWSNTRQEYLAKQASLNTRRAGKSKANPSPRRR